MKLPIRAQSRCDLLTRFRADQGRQTGRDTRALMKDSTDQKEAKAVIAVTEVHAHESKIQGRTAIGSEACVRARKISPDRRFSKENPVPPEK